MGTGVRCQWYLKWLQGEIFQHRTNACEVRPGDSHRTLLVKSKALPEVDIDQRLGFELPISCIPKVMGPRRVQKLIFFCSEHTLRSPVPNFLKDQENQCSDKPT